MSFADNLNKPYISKVDHREEDRYVTLALNAIRDKCLEAHRENKKQICGYFGWDTEFDSVIIANYWHSWSGNCNNHAYILDRINSGIYEIGFTNFKLELQSRDVVARHENYFFGWLSRPIYRKEFALYVQIEW